MTFVLRACSTPRFCAARTPMPGLSPSMLRALKSFIGTFAGALGGRQLLFQLLDFLPRLHKLRSQLLLTSGFRIQLLTQLVTLPDYLL